MALTQRFSCTVSRACSVRISLFFSITETCVTSCVPAATPLLKTGDVRATQRLKDYLLQGYALNQQRFEQNVEALRGAFRSWRFDTRSQEHVRPDLKPTCR